MSRRIGEDMAGRDVGGYSNDRKSMEATSKMRSLHTKIRLTGLFGAEETPTVFSAKLTKGLPIAVPDTRGVATIVPMTGLSGDGSMCF